MEIIGRIYEKIFYVKEEIFRVKIFGEYFMDLVLNVVYVSLFLVVFIFVLVVNVVSFGVYLIVFFFFSLRFFFVLFLFLIVIVFFF